MLTGLQFGELKQVVRSERSKFSVGESAPLPGLVSNAKQLTWRFVIIIKISIILIAVLGRRDACPQSGQDPVRADVIERAGGPLVDLLETVDASMCQ